MQMRADLLWKTAIPQRMWTGVGLTRLRGTLIRTFLRTRRGNPPQVNAVRLPIQAGPSGANSTEAPWPKGAQPCPPGMPGPWDAWQRPFPYLDLALSHDLVHDLVVVLVQHAFVVTLLVAEDAQVLGALQLNLKLLQKDHTVLE